MLSEQYTPRAIAAPHPGESYNPTLDDHQAILAAEYAKAVAEEEDLAKQKAMKDRIMRGRDNLEDSRDTGYANEVGSGDEDEVEGEDRSEGSDNDGAGASTAETKKRKQRRKTEKEKRKKQANKVLEVCSDSFWVPLR